MGSMGQARLAVEERALARTDLSLHESVRAPPDGDERSRVKLLGLSAREAKKRVSARCTHAWARPRHRVQRSITHLLGSMRRM